MMKKSRLLEQLQEIGLVDKKLSGAAKHSRLKGLLNPISIAGGLDNPLVEVDKVTLSLQHKEKVR
jgi:hypothetical protein